MPELNQARPTTRRRKQERPRRRTAIKAKANDADGRDMFFDNFICMDVPDKRPPRYTGWLPLLERRSEVCELEVTDTMELLRMNEDNPYVATIVARQYCPCTDEPCCPPQCCKARCATKEDEGAPTPLASYRIAVIYKNEFHRYHAHDCCTAEYVRCINATHGLNLPYEEWRFDLDERSIAPHVLRENEPCVDLRYRVFEQ